MFMVGLMALRYYGFGWLSLLTKSDYLWVAAFRRIDDGITTSLTNIYYAMFLLGMANEATANVKNQAFLQRGFSAVPMIIRSLFSWAYSSVL
jgi:hypothetical protein